MALPRTEEDFDKIIERLVSLGFYRSYISKPTRTNEPPLGLPLQTVQPAIMLVKSPLKIRNSETIQFADPAPKRKFFECFIEDTRVRVVSDTLIRIVPEYLVYNEVDDVSIVSLWDDGKHAYLSYRIKGKLTSHGYYGKFTRDDRQIAFDTRWGWISAPITSKLVGRYHIPDYDASSVMWTSDTIGGVIVHFEHLPGTPPVEPVYYTSAEAAQAQSAVVVSELLTKAATQ